MGLGIQGMPSGYLESVEACSESVKLKACKPHPLIVIDGEFGWFETFYFRAVTVLCLLPPWLPLRAFEVCSSEDEEKQPGMVDCCSKNKRGGGNFISYPFLSGE